MKNKLLKLARRLNKFTLEEITPILMSDIGEIITALNILVNDNKIKQRADGTYFYIEPKKAKPHPLFFECRSSEELNLIKRCFCADLPCPQTGLVTNLHKNIIFKFNRYFRKVIYNKQFEELITKYDKKPQQARIRYFFEKPVYFYYYQNKIFVSEQILNAKSNKYSPWSKEDIKEFKRIYCMINRRICHNGMKNHLADHVAEAIWRNGLTFDSMITSLD